MIDVTADDASWKNHLNLALKKPSPPWVESQKRQSLILATCVIWGNLAEFSEFLFLYLQYLFN